MKRSKPWDVYRGKRVVIMGLGVHGGGLGAARFFARIGARVIVTDTKEKKDLAHSLQKLSRYRNIAYVLGRHRARDFKTADLIIRNPAVRTSSPFLALARKHGVPIESDISLFFLWSPHTIIGVTGTKGKSTTTACIKVVLETTRAVRAGGNIGGSALELLRSARKNDIILLELSSWQLESMAHVKKSPHIAVITNIERDHLNTYKNAAEYKKAKLLIFKYQTRNDWLCVSPPLLRTVKKARSRIRIFRDTPALKKKLGAASFRLIGAHNRANAAAALAVGRIFGISKNRSFRALNSIRPLFGRYETVSRAHGITWINDTCSTAPYSTIQSIISTSAPVTLITGGTDKALSYRSLAGVIDARIRNLILLSGSATEKLKKYLSLPYTETKNIKTAVAYARHAAKRGETVLFSPAAASFELFENEFDRGRKFISAVRSLRY